MAEENTNLWAPWRMEYIQSLEGEAGDDGCFLCRYWANPADDTKNHVLWRTDRVMVVMNRFPYTNGHLLIAPSEHIGELTELPDDVLSGMGFAARDAVRVLSETIHPHGFNVGINLGRCAGAGLPGHVHTHVVPRWNGDTNFMAILGDVRVVPQALGALHDQLTAVATNLGFTGGSGTE